MDTLFVNKATAAVLVAGIAFFVAGMVADELVKEPRPAKLAIAIEGAPAAGNAPAPAEQPLPVLLASASAERGQQLTAQQGCVACHSFNEGGKAGVGPNLYGVVGAPHGHMEGYAYSTALKGKQGPWTFDELNQWLTKPSAYAPGTKMSYAGLADPAKRADIIVYLDSLSHTPEPLPAVPAATAQPAAAVTTAPKPGEPAEAQPIAARLASASADRGKADTAKLGCIACHSFNDGGKAGIGPNLYGVVGAPHGHMEGYAYSAALKGKQGPWTDAELDQWLTKPSAYAPGTKMSFAGIPDPASRADVIAYLNSLGGHPEDGAAPAAPTQQDQPAQ